MTRSMIVLLTGMLAMVTFAGQPSRAAGPMLSPGALATSTAGDAAGLVESTVVVRRTVVRAPVAHRTVVVRRPVAVHRAVVVRRPAVVRRRAVVVR